MLWQWIKRTLGSKDYLQTSAWQGDRRATFQRDGYQCRKCQTTQDLSCDHIFPRSIYWWLEQRRLLMQCMCQFCNRRKATNIKDYRYWYYRVFLNHWLLFIVFTSWELFKLITVLFILLLIFTHSGETGQQFQVFTRGPIEFFNSLVLHLFVSFNALLDFLSL